MLKLLVTKINSISINVYPPHPQKKVVGMMPPHLRVVVVDYFLPIARQGWDWQSRLGGERELGMEEGGDWKQEELPNSYLSCFKTGLVTL